MPDPQPSVYTAPARSSFWQKLGPGGLVSFSLAASSVLALAGMPLLWRMIEVLREANFAPPSRADGILVLGRRLRDDNSPTEVFLARLAHAEKLWRGGFAARVIVAGGLTGRATLSEAEVGRIWLLEHALPPEAVMTEDKSQHTLENLYFVRESLRAKGWTSLLLVSDPLHLVRAKALAEGLGIKVYPSPAEDCPPRKGSFGWWRRAALEAFFLHWYRTGLAYSRLVGSRRHLERVT